MKRMSTMFLQVAIVLIGIGVLALMLWEPHLEGVNANAISLYEIYFDDPLLAYAYLGSIPFFVALYKAFKILGYVRQNKTFTQASVDALRSIKYCALLLAGAITGADVFLAIAARLPGATDDPAGAIMLGLIATFASLIISTIAAVVERTLQNAVDIKSENDSTV